MSFCDKSVPENSVMWRSGMRKENAAKVVSLGNRSQQVVLWAEHHWEHANIALAVLAAGTAT
eukprot:6464936-Amphidinium_carterae.2